jgi:hypothetical protein
VTAGINDQMEAELRSLAQPHKPRRRAATSRPA